MGLPFQLCLTAGNVSKYTGARALLPLLSAADAPSASHRHYGTNFVLGVCSNPKPLKARNISTQLVVSGYATIAGRPKSFGECGKPGQDKVIGHFSFFFIETKFTDVTIIPFTLSQTVFMVPQH